ncbi:MAG: HAD family hydrolase [Oscillospiraceae bacterium]|nr:HAD family hydrolase [Oscillospiraceae bacterium]
MKYKAIIFDLDGTLLDTLDDLTASMNYALRTMSMPERTKDEVRGFVGNGLAKLVERALPQGSSEEQCSKALSLLKEHYADHCMDKTGMYDGVREMLVKLRDMGYKLAIVSNKVDTAVQELKVHYFDGLIGTAVGEREGISGKPAPDMVFAAVKELGAELSDCVYVGDSDVDIKTAENSGLPCISVLWGFRGEEFLKAHGAKTMISRPDEIYALI